MPTAVAKPACWKPSIRSPRSGVSQFADWSRHSPRAGAFVLHGRLQGEERETAIGLTKTNRATAKSASTVQTGIRSQTGAPDANAADNARRVYFTQRGPKYRRAFLDWGCFHNEPGFSPPGAISSACSSSAMRRCAGDSLRTATPVGQRTDPAGGEISTWRAEYSAGIAADMADTVSNFSLSFL